MKVKKTLLNEPQGVRCPQCQDAYIRFDSLAAFFHALQRGRLQCPNCGFEMRLDASGSRRALHKLDDLHRKTEQVEKMVKGKGE